MILMIDNYDSFTYNLVQYLGELGQQIQVIRNDELTVEQVVKLKPAAIVISPGPCTPNEAGISLSIVSELSNRIPILGICLGHQTIGQACGGRVVQARHIMHGKTSLIYHDGKGVFCNLPSPFEATRYHSLVVEAESLPPALEITAWTINAAGERDEIMGLRHRFLPMESVQFHPEAILTQHGHALLRNFLNLAQQTTGQTSDVANIEHKLRILPFESRWRAHFYRLNAEWLMKYYYIEEFDQQVLSNPETMILDTGGAIFFALLGEEIVGTCALKQETSGVYELTKMAVTETCQGVGIGRKLLERAIEEFKQRQGETLFLESHDGLQAALRLYEQVGFVHQSSMRPNSHYQRANVYMVYNPGDRHKSCY